MIEEALHGYGLSRKEILVYLASLELGPCPAAHIAKRANIQRELTYAVLNRLIQKGAMAVTIKEKKKHFIAADPRSLVDELNNRRLQIEKILPRLELLKKKEISSEPVCKTYEGTEGVKTFFNEMVDFYEHIPAEERILYGYGSAGKFENFLRWSLPHLIERRVQLGITFKALYSRTPLGREKKKLPLAEIRFLPEGVEPSSFYLLYPNHVGIFIFSDAPIAVQIASPEHYESQKQHFDILWEQAAN